MYIIIYGSRFIRPLCVWPATKPQIIWSKCIHLRRWRRAAILTWSWWLCDPLAGFYGGYSTRRM